MVKGSRVVAFTPVGRQRYMEILARYVDDMVKRGIIDEWILFENCYTRQDIDYTLTLAAKLPYVTLIFNNEPIKRDPRRIFSFYKYMTVDPDAVYVRMDDDICYFDKDAIRTLVEYRLADPYPYLVYANVVNNTRMLYYYQQVGLLPLDWGAATDDIFNHTWTDPYFVQRVHQLALATIDVGEFVATFGKLKSFTVDTFDRGHISVNCFAMLGKDMVDARECDPDEERWLSHWKPQSLNRRNAICGDAVVVHFAYNPQTAVMEGTGMLDRYVDLSKKPEHTRVLITGATGFVGHHLVEHVLKNTDWDIVILDRLDSASSPNRLLEIEEYDRFKHRLTFVWWDLKAELNELVKKHLRGPFDYIFHLAAGSHVDRSIEDPMSFFQDNCIGTVNMLLYAKSGALKKNGRFLYFSTDEVFGPAPMDANFTGYKEWDRLNPNNPYAAAKAAAEMAVIAFAHTYRIPCIITNTMNIYGERQHPEKYVPLVIKKVLTGDKLYIHANKERTQAGKRHYLHARNISAAALWIVQYGQCLDGSAKQGRYNIVGEVELDNLQLAKLIEQYVHEWSISATAALQPLDYELVDFHSSRPGHDLRYALDGEHLEVSGFEYPVSFEDSMRKTVFWTLDHHDQWL